jgi:hypothetical protein
VLSITAHLYTAPEESMCHSRKKRCMIKTNQRYQQWSKRKSVRAHTIERDSTTTRLLAIPVITIKANGIEINAVGIWIKKTKRHWFSTNHSKPNWNSTVWNSQPFTKRSPKQTQLCLSSSRSRTPVVHLKSTLSFSSPAFTESHRKPE